MIRDSAVYLHVGVMKTGTTALQSSVFSRCGELTYFGKPYLPLAYAIRAITTLGSVEWAQQRQTVAEEIEHGFSGAQSPVLISEEEFSSGGERDSAADRGMIAERLHTLFPHAEILIVVRNQFDALRSLHAYVMGMSSSYLPFAPWYRLQEAASGDGRGLDIFDYAALVQTYQAHFPSEKIHVLLYEEMVRCYGDFARKLATVLQLPPEALSSIPIARRNVRPSLRRMRMMQMVQRNPWLIPWLGRIPANVRTQIESFLDSGPPIPSAYDRAMRARVSSRYETSNQWLSGWMGVDLSLLGYPGGTVKADGQGEFFHRAPQAKTGRGERV